jgi:hypothetical protein
MTSIQQLIIFHNREKQCIAKIISWSGCCPGLVFAAYINNKWRPIMALDFNGKNIFHRIVVKFTPAFLPNAKKPYNLKAAYQTVLDIHGIASKAEEYNITTSPKVIEEGLNAGMRLMYHLAADGFLINTPIFSLGVRIPGEYMGTESQLPPEIRPVPRLMINRNLRKYFAEHINVEFGGIDDSESMIAQAIDEATGLADKVITRGHILTINGKGLKVEGDDAYKGQIGVFFKPENGEALKSPCIAVNEHKTLKVLIPTGLTEGMAYRLMVETMSSPKGSSHVLKRVRDLHSDFTLIAA